MNGTPSTTPPIRDGIAGNLRITAPITNTGGNKYNKLISADASMNPKISSIVDISAEPPE